MPTGFAGGAPMGVQLVTSRFQEWLALQAGEVIEAQLPARIWPGLPLALDG